MNDVSISALRSFRAVAQCGSFTAAARDLSISQSAVSRHVAGLEAELAQSLVIRGHRMVKLTPAGERILEAVRRTLDDLDQTVAGLTRDGPRSVVKVLCMPAFASRWLIPRLAQLRETGVDVDIELATSIWDSDYQKERYDIAIHYGDGAWPGAQLLMRDSLVPVISPRLLEGTSMRSLHDLARYCWLHDSLRRGKWRQWLARQDAEAMSSDRNMTLPDAESCLTAAVAGAGIAVGHAVLIEQDLREGRLVEAWPSQLRLSAGYHLLVSKRIARDRSAQAVVRWIAEEAKAFVARSLPDDVGTGSPDVARTAR